MDDVQRRNLVAQWAFDTRSILGRFHLWLDDVEEDWMGAAPPRDFSFTGSPLARAFIMANAVTALGTRLFGRYGEGSEQPKAVLNQVKKDADAISAYALSEGLWYLTRSLPENHAVMISLGEGLMPKAGETPEMGSNPQLGFGRVYARPQVAHILDHCVRRLLNDASYEWEEFWDEINRRGITVWGAAVDTLENTSRFAKGAETGPLAVFHLFDQPMNITRPYEGYMGNLSLPEEVVLSAADRSILIDYLSPRRLVLEALQATYAGLRPEHVHVWTLAGPSRQKRLGPLWGEWRGLGVHLIEDGWELPETGLGAFTESGTYAPSYRVGSWRDEEGRPHVLITDGYAASAEAAQAASLDPVMESRSSLCLFSSKFKVPAERERFVMRLDPDAPDFAERLRELVGEDLGEEMREAYRQNIREARAAGMPVDGRVSTIDDFFPKKDWRVLSLSSAMLPDPYTGMRGVEDLGDGRFRVMTRAATRGAMVEVKLTLRLTEAEPEMRMVFSPLLDRFYAGQDYRKRAVKVSDSGRIRNELQTLASEAIEYLGEDRLRLHLDWVDDEVLSADKKALISEVLHWYQENHPIWFSWLELAE